MKGIILVIMTTAAVVAAGVGAKAELAGSSAPATEPSVVQQSTAPAPGNDADEQPADAPSPDDSATVAPTSGAQVSAPPVGDPLGGPANGGAAADSDDDDDHSDDKGGDRADDDGDDDGAEYGDD